MSSNSSKSDSMNMLGIFMIASGLLSFIAGIFAIVEFAQIVSIYTTPFLPDTVDFGYGGFSVLLGLLIFQLGYNVITNPIWAWRKAILILVIYLSFWLAISVVFPFTWLNAFRRVPLNPKGFLMYVIVPSLNWIALTYLMIGRKHILGEQETLSR